MQRCRQPTDFPVTGYRSGCKRCGPSHDRDGLVYEVRSRFVTGERGGVFAAAGSVVVEDHSEDDAAAAADLLTRSGAGSGAW